MFCLPDYQPFVPKNWKPGADLGFARLCLTQDGTLWLEWFETQVGSKLTGDVGKAEYKQLFVSITGHVYPLPGRFMSLLELAPRLIDRSMRGILELIHRETEIRELRAKRDRELFERLTEIGKHFNISLAP